MKKSDVGIFIVATGLGTLIGMTVQHFRLKALKSVIDQQECLIKRSIDQNVKLMSQILREQGI